MTDFNVIEYCANTVEQIEVRLNAKLSGIEEKARLHNIVEYIKSKNFNYVTFQDRQEDVQALYQKAVNQAASKWNLFSWAYNSLLESDFKKMLQDDFDEALLFCLENDTSLKEYLQVVIQRDTSYELSLDTVMDKLLKKVQDEVITDTLSEAFEGCPVDKRIDLNRHLKNKLHSESPFFKRIDVCKFPLLHAIWQKNVNLCSHILQKVVSVREAREEILADPNQFPRLANEHPILFEEFLRKHKSYFAAFMYLTVFPPSRYHVSIASLVYIVEILGAISVVAPAAAAWYAVTIITRLFTESHHWLQNMVTGGEYMRKETQYICDVLASDDDELSSMLTTHYNKSEIEQDKNFYAILKLYLDRVVEKRNTTILCVEEESNVEGVITDISKEKALILRALLINSILVHYNKSRLILEQHINVKDDKDIIEVRMKNYLNTVSYSFDIPNEIIPQESDDIAKLIERARVCGELGISTPIADLCKTILKTKPYACLDIMHTAYAERITDRLPEGSGARVGSILYRTLLGLLYVPSMLIDTAIVLFKSVLERIFIIVSLVSIELMMLTFNLPIYLYDCTRTIAMRIKAKDTMPAAPSDVSILLENSHFKSDSLGEDDKIGDIGEKTSNGDNGISIFDID